MREPPKLPPHEVGQMLSDLANEHGYSIKKLDLIYWIDINEVLTKIRNLASKCEIEENPD